MILVTVGSSLNGLEFDRLIREMDRIAGIIQEPVLMQIGTSAYKPARARSFDFVPLDQMQEHCRSAAFIVGHCGSGTVLQAMQFQVPLIAVPRRVDQRELDMDDHQLQLARRLEGKPGFVVVYDVAQLEAAVKDTLRKVQQGTMPKPEWSGREDLIKRIRSFLTELESAGQK